MDNCTRAVPLQELADETTINDVAAHELVSRVLRNLRKVLKIARVGELIHYDNGPVLRGDPLQDEARPYEAGCAGDHNWGFGWQFRPQRRCFGSGILDGSSLVSTHYICSKPEATMHKGPELAGRNDACSYRDEQGDSVN